MALKLYFVMPQCYTEVAKIHKLKMRFELVDRQFDSVSTFAACRSHTVIYNREWTAPPPAIHFHASCSVAFEAPGRLPEVVEIGLL